MLALLALLALSIAEGSVSKGLSRQGGIDDTP